MLQFSRSFGLVTIFNLNLLILCLVKTMPWLLDRLKRYSTKTRCQVYLQKINFVNNSFTQCAKRIGYLHKKGLITYLLSPFNPFAPKLVYLIYLSILYITCQEYHWTVTSISCKVSGKLMTNQRMNWMRMTSLESEIFKNST